MKREGFGLIETLITLALSAFFIAGTGELILESLRLKQRSEAVLRSAQLAASTLETLRAADFAEARLASGEHEDRVADPATHLSYRRVWTVDDTSPDVKDVDLTVTCENGRARSARVWLRLDRTLGF